MIVFSKNLINCLKTMLVGHPLYIFKNLSRKMLAKIYLKREDLNHTGAHKINNTIGQIILAKDKKSELLLKLEQDNME